MEPDDAYKTALYYTEGAGRGRTWISALAEGDDDRESHRSVAMSQATDRHQSQPSARYSSKNT